ARRSARIESASPPEDGTAVAPLVMDAGDTLVAAALAGSTKSMSIRSITAPASASRTRRSADGLEKRISSLVRTEIAATLFHRSSVAVKSNELSGFGAPSPTQ